MSVDVTFFESLPYYTSSNLWARTHTLCLACTNFWENYFYIFRGSATTSDLLSLSMPNNSPRLFMSYTEPRSYCRLASSHQPIALQKGIQSPRNSSPHYTFLSYHRISSPHYDIVSSWSSISIPKTTGEKLSHSGWRQARINEMPTLHMSGTWELVSLPAGKSSVGCHWVYAFRIGPDGQVEWLKARLVAKA